MAETSHMTYILSFLILPREAQVFVYLFSSSANIVSIGISVVSNPNSSKRDLHGSSTSNGFDFKPPHSPSVNNGGEEISDFMENESCGVINFSPWIRSMTWMNPLLLVI